MNRQHEIQAIERHIQTHGVYRCKMREMYYSEDGPGFRERMASAIERGKRYRVERIKKVCERDGCETVMILTPGQSHQKYCCPDCGHKARARNPRGVNVRCDHCGEIHYREPRRNQTINKFCSQECNKAWRRK